MDSLLNAAARALAHGDPLGALKRIALRDDAPALALRGIAMAQLGDLARAKELLRRAARAFAPREEVARARCVLASAEVALAARDLAPARSLDAALRTLDAHGDRFNWLHGRLVAVRRLLLLGRTGEAERSLGQLDLALAPPMLAAIGEMCAADIALRSLHTTAARAALGRALAAAVDAGVPALAAEVARAQAGLTSAAARVVSRGRERPIVLAEVERVLTSPALVVDACRRRVRDGGAEVALARRPVLFALARALAEAWPDDLTRDELILRAFGAGRANPSHRARLRVEVGRLRRELRGMASIGATGRGFLLAPRRAAEVVVLAPPIDGDDAALVALLADGQAWSTSALALALGASQRTVQRALSALQAAGKVSAIGRARARRWLAPPALGFTTTLLLPTSLAGG